MKIIIIYLGYMKNIKKEHKNSFMLTILNMNRSISVKDA